MSGSEGRRPSKEPVVWTTDVGEDGAPFRSPLAQTAVGDICEPDDCSTNSIGAISKAFAEGSWEEGLPLEDPDRSESCRAFPLSRTDFQYQVRRHDPLTTDTIGQEASPCLQLLDDPILRGRTAELGTLRDYDVLSGFALSERNDMAKAAASGLSRPEFV